MTAVTKATTCAESPPAATQLSRPLRGEHGVQEKRAASPPHAEPGGKLPDPTLRRCCVGPHFTGEDTEAQGGDAMAPRDTGGEGGHR